MNRRSFFSALACCAVASKLPVKPATVTVPVAVHTSCLFAIRATVIPELTKVLEAGIHGNREKWMRLFAEKQLK